MVGAAARTYAGQCLHIQQTRPAITTSRYSHQVDRDSRVEARGPGHSFNTLSTVDRTFPGAFPRLRRCRIWKVDVMARRVRRAGNTVRCTRAGSPRGDGPRGAPRSRWSWATACHGPPAGSNRHPLAGMTDQPGGPQWTPSGLLGCFAAFVQDVRFSGSARPDQALSGPPAKRSLSLNAWPKCAAGSRTIVTTGITVGRRWPGPARTRVRGVGVDLTCAAGRELNDVAARRI